MRAGSNLTYSNDLNSAFLTSIIRAFERKHPKGYLGRTALQKLAYFTKVLGVPIPASFGIYTYGPYSDSITFTVESLLADDVIADHSTKPKYSNYRLASNAQELLEEFADELRPHERTIENVVEVLGGFEPPALELIATLHFIAEKEKKVSSNTSKESVVARFKSIKKDKFADLDVSRWYDALGRAGLI